MGLFHSHNSAPLPTPFRFSPQDRSFKMLTIYPLALILVFQIGRNAKFLRPLIDNKWPLGFDPGGHHFLLLNVSINKTAVFVSEVVTYKNISRLGVSTFNLFTRTTPNSDRSLLLRVSTNFIVVILLQHHEISFNIATRFKHTIYTNPFARIVDIP